jgi:hypothetical protein
MAAREMLQRRLDELEELMPELVRKYPDQDDLMQEFCGYADRITEETTAEDDSWAHEALDGMLTRYGFPPRIDDPPGDG